MLDTREAELRAWIDELRAQLGPAELELEDLLVAKEAIKAQAARRLLKLPATGNDASAASLAYFNTPGANSQFHGLTMKSLVRKALSETFPQGATARQLLDLFHHEYGRVDIIRSSLSPQLSRLRVEGVIWRDGLIWRLTEPGQKDIFGEQSPTENGEASAEPETGRGGATNASPT